MTKLRQKATFQVWYNGSKGSETISEPEINKNLDWYIVNNFLTKVDEVKSDGNTSEDNETLLSTFSMDCFPFRHMQLDNSSKDGPSIKTRVAVTSIDNEKWPPDMKLQMNLITNMQTMSYDTYSKMRNE